MYNNAKVCIAIVGNLIIMSFLYIIAKMKLGTYYTIELTACSMNVFCNIIG